MVLHHHVTIATMGNTLTPIQTPQRCRRGQMLNKLQMWTRKKERESCCKLVWCLEIMCIFSHESIEKSLPHNLQENSRGEDNREESETPDVNEGDGETEVLWKSNVTRFLRWLLIQINFSYEMHTRGNCTRGVINHIIFTVEEDGIDLTEFYTKTSAKGLVWVCKADS